VYQPLEIVVSGVKNNRELTYSVIGTHSFTRKTMVFHFAIYLFHIVGHGNL